MTPAHSPSPLASSNRKAVLSLAAIMALRILGLFMLLPVLSLFSDQFLDATPTTLGIALGIYGLTQACLQIPFGSWSDHIGRKPVILLGLLLFILGSLMGAVAHHVWELIIARALQGGGAIGSTVMAYVADLTPDESRTQSMAILGLCIGFAFTLALILGPIFSSFAGLHGLFLIMAGLGGLAIFILYTSVPNSSRLVVAAKKETTWARFKVILSNAELLRLDYGIAAQHAGLTAMFIAIPILLSRYAHLKPLHMPYVYLIVTILSFVAMFPFIILAEKYRKMKSVFCGAIGLILLCQCLLLKFHQNLYQITLILFLFFTAFTLLEACLPSLVSKIAPIRIKGAAMGVYSSAQFLGIFIGGSAGGIVFAHFGVIAVFGLAAGFTLIWLALALTMTSPPYLATLIVPLPHQHQADADTQLYTLLSQQPGVNEVAIMPQENLVYLKVDRQKIDEPRLRALIERGKLAS